MQNTATINRQQSLFTFLNVVDTFPTDPYSHQKTRTNADKAETQAQNEDSGNAEKQREIVKETYQNHPDGLTDKEIWKLTAIFPSTVSARRNDFIDGKVKGFTVVPIIVNGKPLKRDGGKVNKLVSK